MRIEKKTLGDGTTYYKARPIIDGKKETVRAATRSEVARQVATLKDKQRRRRLGLPDPEQRAPEVTYDELCERVLSQYAKTEASKKTLTYNLDYSRSQFGAVRIRELTSENIGAWLVRLENRLGGPLAATTKANALKAMRQVLNAGVTWKYLDANPARDVELPESEDESKHPFESWDEVFAVAEAIDRFYRPLVLFACATGLRPQEWLPLRLGDVDRQARILRIRRTVRDGEVAEGKAKTRGSLRTVELQQIALDALPDVLLTPLTRDQLVFPGKRGGMIDLHSWREKTWRKALEAAGFAYRSPYAMRDTYATLAFAAGVPVESVAKQMGHVDRHGNPRPATTLRYYARFLPSVGERNLALLDNFAQASFGTGLKADSEAEGAGGT